MNATQDQAKPIVRLARGSLGAPVYEIRRAVLLQNGQPVAPKLRVVQVAASDYQRGIATRELNETIFFEEALRLFNWGTQDGLLIKKHFQPLSKDAIRGDIIHRHGPGLTAALYRHCQRVFNKGINGRGSDAGAARSDFAATKKIGTKVVKPPGNQGGDYFDRLMLDEHQNALLVARLWCDDWATDKARPNVIDFRVIRALHEKVLAELKVYTYNLSIAERSYYFRQRFDLPAFANGAMRSAERLGNDSQITIGQPTAFEWLSEFARPRAVTELGVAEKFYATFIALKTLRLEAEPVFDCVMDWHNLLDIELAKLTAPHPLATKPLSYPVLADAKAGWTQLDRWRFAAYVMKANVLGYLRALPDLIQDSAALGPMQSDLLWGAILLDYMHLLLLHLQILTVYASVPFRQIYCGGLMAPLTQAASVDGLSGMMAIALWEYFAYPGINHPHGVHHTARNAFADFPNYSRGVPRVIDINWVEAKDARRFIAADGNRLRVFTGSVFGFEGSSTTAVGVIQEIAGSSRALDLLASANSEPLPPKPRRQPWPTFRETLAQRWREARGLDFHRSFPIDYPVNPQYHRSIFNLPSQRPVSRTAVGLDRRLFQGWGFDDAHKKGFAVSLASHGAKIEAQLQAYVFAWLIDRWRRDRGDSATPTFAPHLILTCANALYGGKFTPHLSHRDGYGHDISLTDGRGPYHSSTFWPLDTMGDNKVVDRAGNKTKAFTLLKGFDAPPRKTAIEFLHSLDLLAQKPNTAVEAREMLKAVYDLRKGERTAAMPQLVHTLSAATIVPKDASIVSWFDFYSPGREVPAATANCEPRLAYRELLREALESELDGIRTVLPYATQSAAIDKLLLERERRLDDWPIYSNEASHVSHHAGHLAMICAQPVEVIWGSPLYHVRALRALAVVFLEKRRPNVFTPRANPRDPADQVWMRVPQLHFMPHNHHHHWHVNFWREDDGLPAYIRNVPQDVHLARAMYLWTALGVDFWGFIYYLDELEGSLTSAAAASDHPKGARAILNSLKAMRVHLLKVMGTTTPESQAAADELRIALFSRVESYGLADIQGPEPHWRGRRQWPTPGSALDSVIQKSKKIHDYMSRAIVRAAEAVRRSAIANDDLQNQIALQPDDDPDAELHAKEALQRDRQRDEHMEQLGAAATGDFKELRAEDPALDDFGSSDGADETMGAHPLTK